MAEKRVDPKDKAELVAFIKAARQSLEQALEGLTEAQMLQPGVEGDWSVKEVLAHLSAWEKRMHDWIAAARRGEVPQIPAPGMTWNDVDTLNAQTYAQVRDLPLAEVLRDFKQTYAETLKLVDALPEADLMAADRFEWRKGKALWKLVAADTWWHYKEHDGSIRKALGG